MKNIELLESEAINVVSRASDLKSLEQIKVDYLGKKGLLTSLLKELGKLSPEERPEAGAQINIVKQSVLAEINLKRQAIEYRAIESQLAKESIDITLPGRSDERGSLHLVTHTMERIESFFLRAGYKVEKGPEIEDDYHNFEALNIPAHILLGQCTIHFMLARIKF